MQLANGDKNLFYKFFSFIIEKFDFPVKMPREKEALWIRDPFEVFALKDIILEIIKKPFFGILQL